MNKAITIHLTIHAPNAGDYIIRLHSNAIIKNESGIVSVCNGNYKLTATTKKAIMECLGGNFAGTDYFINGRVISLSSEWQSVTD